MIAARRLLVVGAREPEVKALAALQLAPDVSTVIADYDVEAAVYDRLEIPTWAVLVAPCALSVEGLSAVTANALLAANLTVCRDATRAVCRAPTAVRRLVFVTWASWSGGRPLHGAVASAVGQLGRVLAIELGPIGLTVNTVQLWWDQMESAHLALVLHPDAGSMTGEVLTPA